MIAAIWAALGGIRGLLNFGTSIATEIAKAKIAVTNAETEQERIAAAERLGELQARAASHGRFTIILQIFAAVPCIFIIGKILVYDKAFGGFTDPLGADAWALIYGVYAYLFLMSRR